MDDGLLPVAFRMARSGVLEPAGSTDGDAVNNIASVPAVRTWRAARPTLPRPLAGSPSSTLSVAMKDIAEGQGLFFYSRSIAPLLVPPTMVSGSEDLTGSAAGIQGSLKFRRDVP